MYRCTVLKGNPQWKRSTFSIQAHPISNVTIRGQCSSTWTPSNGCVSTKLTPASPTEISWTVCAPAVNALVMLGVQCLVSAFNYWPLNEHIVRFIDISDKYDFIYLFFPSLVFTLYLNSFKVPMLKGKWVFLWPPGYDVTEWKDVLLKLNQTKTYFSTNAASPFCSEWLLKAPTLNNADVKGVAEAAGARLTEAC